jgi:acyl-CoA synthetase (AMP-forming)/AMP-acid ligase II
VITNFGMLGAGTTEADDVVFIEAPASATPLMWTRAAFDEACDAVAAGLTAAGIGVGDRIVVLGPNSVRYLTIVYGAMRAGVVPVPVNVKLPADQTTHIIEDAKARVVFADDLPASLAARVDRVVPLEGNGFDDFLRPGGFTAIDPADDLPALQLYTSGSTGVPKGVVLNHSAKLWATQAYTPPVPGRDVRAVVASPLYHKNGFLVSAVALGAGGTVALLAKFDAREYLESIARHRMTFLSGVPTMFVMLLEQADLLEALDLSSVSTVLIGSAPLTQALLDKVKAAFPNAVVTNNYGTTEVAAIFGRHPEGKPRPLNSVGVLLPGSEARLVDGPSPDEGVLQVRNPSVMLGYHNLPEATAARLHDGWYDTGDVMRRDADGFYYFVGRNDDMFVCGGENVYPGEVESLLERHPAIRAAAVVSVPDERKGAVPVAFVVPATHATLTEDEVKRFALAGGPAYAHPRQVVFLDDLPLSGTNKVDKQRLTQQATERSAR